MSYIKPMSDWTLKFAKTITNKVKQNSFMHTTILGERNHGKTYYALKNMALAHYNIDSCSEYEAWSYALKHLIFTVQDFKRIVRYNRTHNIKSPYILLDDAGSHFDSGLYHRNPYLYQLLNTCLDTIKDVTNCLIVTCPFKETLTMRLREYDGYDITMYMDSGYERYCTCIKWYRRPTGDKRWDKRWEDYFSCYIPNEIHYKYLDIRNKFTLDQVDKMDELEKKYEKKLHKK